MVTKQQANRAALSAGFIVDFDILKDVESAMLYLVRLANYGRVIISMQGGPPAQVVITYLYDGGGTKGIGTFKGAVCQLIENMFPLSEPDQYLVDHLVDTYAHGEYNSYRDKVLAAEINSKAAAAELRHDYMMDYVEKLRE